ncbi:MAG: tyrosine recombinase [Clostridia bacterium]|nr:tyrosine recombinase [Clostridia bacterium]MDD4375958.1 tyrosine recombinase [Clostridia bacterium]
MELIIQDFMEYLKSRQVSKNTLVSYERDINQLVAHLNDVGKKMIEATKDDLQNYVVYMQTMGKSNATISRSVASIKAFYKYLLKNKIVEENITEELIAPKVEKKELSILTAKEIENLLEQPSSSDLKGQRDKAMLEVLYATGIRVTELISIKMSDTNVNSGYIKVKKKNKERTIPIGNVALKFLKEYIENVRPLLIKTEEEETLFINANGQKMTRQGFWKILKQYKEQAKIDKELTPHTIRHSFAVHLLQNGAEVKMVQEILGHTDVASTLMYTQMADMKLRDEYLKAHPRG